MLRNHKGIKRLINLVYTKLFKIDDTPQKIAAGFGLGVFAGLLPGAGPVASLFLAFIFRVNRIAALAGSLLTNTWASLVFFLLSIRIGSIIMNLKWQDVHLAWLNLLKDFKLANFFKLGVLKIILPVATGYFIIALLFGVLAYMAVIIIFKARKKA
ncbi:MAG TPA: DUF2062 domain-containing protein [Candidatus Omnitrophota bacterium]|nr:DUF2062 domain-containing protein [Candidatus Omnitrophota bacterium]